MPTVTSTNGASSGTPRTSPRFTGRDMNATITRSTAFDELAARLVASWRRDDGGVPLPQPLRKRLEAFFGAGLSDVRIHPASALAQAVGAHALAVGSHVHFAPGRFDPASAAGLRTLGHELAHVLQQRCGRVLAPQGVAPAIVYDRRLEVEADLAGDAAARFVACGTGARLAVDPSGTFSLDELPDLTVDDFVRFRSWLDDHASPATALQCVTVMPGWWSAPVAANVEAYVAANVAALPNPFMLYHGTTPAFHTQVTGFNGSEQGWVNNFFQFNIGANAHCGPGIYGADNLATAQGYGANVMKVISSTFARTRYVDITGVGVFAGAAVTSQDVRRHAYRCILKYTLNYFAVKDHRVEWEPH